MKDSVFRRCVERRFDFPKHVVLDFRSGSRSCLLAMKLPKIISLSAHIPIIGSRGLEGCVVQAYAIWAFG